MERSGEFVGNGISELQGSVGAELTRVVRAPARLVPQASSGRFCHATYVFHHGR